MCGESTVFPPLNFPDPNLCCAQSLLTPPPLSNIQCCRELSKIGPNHSIAEVRYFLRFFGRFKERGSSLSPGVHCPDIIPVNTLLTTIKDWSEEGIRINC